MVPPDDYTLNDPIGWPYQMVPLMLLLDASTGKLQED